MLQNFYEMKISIYNCCISKILIKMNIFYIYFIDIIPIKKILEGLEVGGNRDF